MSKDPEYWRDVLTNFEHFLKLAPDHQTEWWEDQAEGRTAGQKASLAYRWKEEALGKFHRVTREDRR